MSEDHTEAEDGVENEHGAEQDAEGVSVAETDPFAELDDAPLGERTPATDDELFEEMDREELADEDGLVESLLEGEEVETDAGSAVEAASGSGSANGSESNGSGGPASPDASDEGASAGAGADPVRDEVVVPKRRYCEGCQYFSDPPETACEHPGTDILELVDTDHFLVADCPVVEWRRDLEAYPNPDEAVRDPRE